MNKEIQQIIKETIFQMIDESSSQKNIARMKVLHSEKVHFIPIRYRIFGGILQSLNIRFGNFIEKLVGKIITVDPGIQVIPESGKKIKLFMTEETDSLIDKYITSRQLPNSPDDCTPLFDELLQSIMEIESNVTKSNKQGISKDIDGLFRTSDGLLVFTELKYNDDHDTGKFVDINRKFIKTWAGLVTHYKLTSQEQLLPIIYYFNPTKRYGPIYTPGRNILRGSQLFDKFFVTKYEEVDQYLKEISEDIEIVKKFDRLMEKIPL